MPTRPPQVKYQGGWGQWPEHAELLPLFSQMANGTAEAQLFHHQGMQLLQKVPEVFLDSLTVFRQIPGLLLLAVTEVRIVEQTAGLGPNARQVLAEIIVQQSSI